MISRNEEFNDGLSAARHWVTVQLDGDGLRLNSGARAIDLYWPFEKLRAIEVPRPGTPLRLTCATDPDARLRLSDPVHISALRQQAPQLFLSGLARPNVRRNTSIIVLVLALLALLLWQGIPLASAPLARLIPFDWVHNYGEAFRDEFLADAKICQTANGAAALSKLAEKLISTIAQPPELTLMVADQGAVNAFALPGGHIVILRGLLERAESFDEVAAVLAHEIGHVYHLHPTQMAIRAIGVSLFADLFTGDGSAIMEAVSGVGGVLLLMNYSRDMERQADAFGQNLLRQAGLPTGGMARFFARMKDGSSENSTTALLGYFSSHPPLDERIAATVKGDAGQPALDAEAWQALRNICG